MHENTIETYPECDIVCVDCAFVLDRVYTPILQSSHTDIDITVSELITDVFYNLNLSLSCLEISKKNYQKHRSNNDLKSYKNHEIACFVVYNVLIEQKIPTHMEDICMHFDTCQSRIWNIQKSIETFEDLDPCLLIPRIITELEIPYFLREEIQQIVRQLELISTAKPETIAACAIYIVTKKHNHIPLTTICYRCRISVSSVLSLFRRYGRA